MSPTEFLDELERLLVPAEYRARIVENVPEGWRFYRKGAYVFAAVPYRNVPPGDYANRHVKQAVKKIVLAFPFFAEKGLFLLHHGPESSWRDHKERHTVDTTALRPVILQSIHFVDPETGANYNTRTAWGPIRFGFCAGVIEKIEALCGGAAQ